MKNEEMSGLLLVMLVVCSSIYYSFTKKELLWAYATSVNGAVLSNETCRESLADVIYNKVNKPEHLGSNTFRYSGSEIYDIHAFKTFAECDSALTNAVVRSRYF